MKKFLIATAIIGGLGMAGCAALAAAGANEVSKSIEAEQALDKPVTVTEGQAFTHDGYRVDAGWDIAFHQFEGLSIEGLSVTNVSHDLSGDTPMFTFRLYDGKTVLAEVEADGHSLQKGQSTEMDTFSFDSVHGVPAFTRISVEDMW